jgi:hypothetical protein
MLVFHHSLCLTDFLVYLNIGAIVCYVLLGTPAGYTSARLYKSKTRYLPEGSFIDHL